jgi:hypothetical protein
MALAPAPMTVAYAQARLTDWLTALEAASTGTSYSIEGQTLTRQDVPTIRAEIQRWSNTVAALHERLQGRVRPMGAVAAFPTPGGSGGIIPDALWTSGQT